MRQLDLVQDPADPRRWVLPGIGTLLRTGRVSRSAVGEAGGRRWSIRRSGLVRTGFSATDEAGTVVGEVRNPIGGRSDRLRWGERELRLTWAGSTLEGYAVWDAGRRLSVMAPVRSGHRQLRVVIEDPQVSPGLLLFQAFVAQAYEDDASFPPAGIP